MGPRRFYYGWVNLIVAALAMVATLPGRTQGLGIVTEPLIAELSLDRVAYATINLWATLIGALFCLPCGRLTDRLGSRVVLAALLASLGATVIVMGQVSGLIALCLAVTLTRGLGQSALSVVSLALAGKWFARRLNYAMGIYSLLVGVGFIIAFPTVGQAVLSFGWRAAWTSMGVALLIAAPVAWLLVRDDAGLAAQEGPRRQWKSASGHESPRTSNSEGEHQRKLAPGVGPRRQWKDDDPEGLALQPSDLTMWEALRSSAFWTFALASSVFGLVYSGIALFNQSILEQRGFDATTYYTVLAVSAMLALLANFGGGWVASWWPIQRVMGIGMAALAAALLALPHVATQAHVMLYAAAMGVSGGIVTVVFFSVWGEVFGRTHLGRIQGAAQTMTVLASAIGPLLLAETMRRTGSYDVMFYGLAAIVVALGFGCWFVPLPHRQGPS